MKTEKVEEGKGGWAEVEGGEGGGGNDIQALKKIAIVQRGLNSDYIYFIIHIHGYMTMLV